jgi:acylpyruvate hydrolase
MRLVAFSEAGVRGLAIEIDGQIHGLLETDQSFPGDVDHLLRQGNSALTEAGVALANGQPRELDRITYLPPLARPAKIICIGLNYSEHTEESPYEQPSYPTVFARFASGFVGHRGHLIRPKVSDQLDYEGEMVAIIGKPARHVPLQTALDHVVGYSIFNDGSIRDFQFKSPQWTVGKNFDGTGGFGPAFVTADELPPGGAGLRIETRLNGEVLQSSNTERMIYPVAELISILSEAFVLEPGDMIVTGTPSGIGFSRKPQIFMRPGDVCEVAIEGIGTLANPIVGEQQRVASTRVV